MRVVIAALLVTACSPETRPISRAEAQRGCELICARDVKCNIGFMDRCFDICIDSTGYQRADEWPDYAACVGANPCGPESAIDPCVVPRLDVHERWPAACEEIHRTCGPPRLVICNPTNLGDTYGLSLVAEDVMQELYACLDASDCQGERSCLESVGQRYNMISLLL